MQTKDFTTQHTIRYLSNKNNFSKQPLFVLTNNMGLTGDDFIAVYRIARGQGFDQTYRESAAIPTSGALNAISGDGVLGITIGSSQGLTSATGSNRINADSLTSGDGQSNSTWSAGVAATSNLLSTTSVGTEYIITMTMRGTDRIDIIVDDGTEKNTDITLTGLPAIADMNIIGNGIRPKGRQTSTYVVDATTDMNGGAGSADITTYLYNQQDAQQQWASSGLTGVFDLSYNGLSAAIVGKAAGAAAQQVAGVQGPASGTVTGWCGGPIEGGFRMDGNSYMEGVTSSLFNTRDHVTTGMTMMTYVRFHATGSNQTFMNIAGAEDGYNLSMSGGAFAFNNQKSSITAGTLTTAAGTVGQSTNNMFGQHNVLLNKWYHVAAVITATGSDSGMRIYVDGTRMPLARTRQSTAAGVHPPVLPLSASISGSSVQDTGGSADVIAMPQLTSPRLLMSTDRELHGSQVAHDLALTRVFNRPLSDSEIFQNHIATIPSNIFLYNVKIG